MWNLFAVLIIGAPLVLAGWLIGRQFVPMPKGAGLTGGGQGSHRTANSPILNSLPVKIEWLVEDIAAAGAGEDLVKDYWRNFQLRRALLNAARKIMAGAAKTATVRGNGPEIAIRLRRIGRWIFSSPGDDQQSGSETRGLEFLKPSQIIIQSALTPNTQGGRDLVIVLWSNRDGDQAGFLDGLGRDRIILRDWNSNRNTANRLKGFMSAYLAYMQSGLGQAQLGRSQLGQSRLGRYLLELADASFAADGDFKRSKNTAEADRDYLSLKAWVSGKLGRENCDAAKVNEALSIFRDLDRELDKERVPDPDKVGAGSIWLNYNIARMALAEFELSGRNPERLLEADDYCGRALGQFVSAENHDNARDYDQNLVSKLRLLRARVRRHLAVHDGSITGLERAEVILDQLATVEGVDATELDGRGEPDEPDERLAELGFKLEPELKLERGYLCFARGELGRDPGQYIAALSAFQQARKIFANGDERTLGLRLDVVAGIAQCLLVLGREQRDAGHYRQVIKLVEEIAIGQTDFGVTHVISRMNLRSAHLLICKVEALYELGVLTARPEHIDEGLEFIEGIGLFASDVWGARRLAARRVVVRAKLLLSRAETGEDPQRYIDAINGVKSGTFGPRDQNPLDPQNTEISTDDKWQIMSGLVRVTLMLTKAGGGVQLHHGMERDAEKLVLLARATKNNLRMAEAECLLADVLIAKFDQNVTGDVEDIKLAINGLRRALDLAPRLISPKLWAIRQSRLGALLAKYGELKDDIAGLESAVLAYKKSLEELDLEISNGHGNGNGNGMNRLFELGQVFKALSRKTGDPSYRANAEAVFAQAYDASQAYNMHDQVRQAEQALAQLRGEAFH